MTTTEQARIAGDKIRKNIERLSVERAGVKVTASGGIASAADSGFDTEKFINNADRALYKAKENGRNRVYAHEVKKRES
jgi:diguanylate cyclase (GGDEF)-like protein